MRIDVPADGLGFGCADLDQPRLHGEVDRFMEMHICS
jgi:hypothetical protein